MIFMKSCLLEVTGAQKSFSCTPDGLTWLGVEYLNLVKSTIFEKGPSKQMNKFLTPKFIFFSLKMLG